MKIIIYIFIFLLIQVSCSDKKNDCRHIELENNIGTLKISLFGQFDSYNKSFKKSDCGCCCNEYWYSFTNSKLDNYPYNDTIDYFVKLNNDSLIRNSITISHPACVDCHEKKQLDQELLIKHYKDRMEMYLQEHTNWIFLDSSIVTINKRNYSMLSYINIWQNNKLSEVLEAFTIVNNEPISIEFKRIGYDSTDFITKAKEVLNTIEIVE